jgi:sec-independent protein translocase protein TatC
MSETVHNSDSDPSGEEARMTFTQHLGELRNRIIRCAIFTVVGMVFCYIFSDQIFQWLKAPLDQPDNSADWQQFNIVEGVLVRLKLAFFGGLVLALPFIMHQICAFVFPGLRAAERKVIQIMLAGCSVLAIIGVSVAYWGIFPVVLVYLQEMGFEGVGISLRLNENVSIILKLMLGFAVAFQFPMAVLVLVYMDLLTPADLKSYRKVAIVGMAVVAMMFTPPDPLSMLMMLTPLALLYEASIWMSYIVVRRREKA